MTSSAAPGEPPLEIERSYLLRGMPPLPEGAFTTLRIAQGYLPIDARQTLGVEGRIRSIQRDDGSVEYVHTVKTGTGLVRTEIERSLDADEFNRLWPATEGRRLTKTRYRVRQRDPVLDTDFTWEIDRFNGLDLVLAEVELPTAAAVATPPSWLAPFIVREVTDEPAYRNFEIARRIGLL